MVGVAESIDTYGNSWKIISNDNEKLRINSTNRASTELILPYVSDEFGGVVRVLALLLSYGFDIVYVQDVSKSFTDRDVFVTTFIKPNHYKYVESETAKIIYGVDGITQLIPNLEGIVLNF